MKLPALRKQAGLSQTELAEALGIKQAAVSAYERGTRTMTLDRAKEIIDVLVAHGVAAKFEDLLQAPRKAAA